MYKKTLRRRAVLKFVTLQIVYLSSLSHCCAVENESDASGTIALQAMRILENHCDKCHGSKTKSGYALDVREIDLMKKTPSDSGEIYLAAGDPERSMIWQQIESDEMPKGERKLSDNEKRVVKDWIKIGSPSPAANLRSKVSRLDVLRAIESDMQQFGERDRRFQRYFTLAEVHNRTDKTEADLRVYRAAFSKAINSLSHSKEIVLPKFIDKDKVVCRVDERDLGWEFFDFDILRKAYPYAVSMRQSERATHEKIVRHYELDGFDYCDGLVVFRIDWFVSRALAPKIYHRLAKIPENLSELYRRMNIDYQKSFASSRLVRGGVLASGVSDHNRMLEFIQDSDRDFWISFDFSSSTGKQSLLANPLGPRFERNEFVKQNTSRDPVFNHAGGEVIYSLRNGLHGYMLVDDVDARIDDGPTSIVQDRGQNFGTSVISNGISCFGCHKAGMIPFEDDIRKGHAIDDIKGKDKVFELYAEKERMDRLIAESRERYLASLRKCIEPFALPEDRLLPNAGSVSDAELIEPISFVVRAYEKPITAADLELELDLNGVDLSALITRSGTLQKMGLAPLANERGTIKRQVIDAKTTGFVGLLERLTKEINIEN